MISPLAQRLTLARRQLRKTADAVQTHAALPANVIAELQALNADCAISTSTIAQALDKIERLPAHVEKAAP